MDASRESLVPGLLNFTGNYRQYPFINNAEFSKNYSISRIRIIYIITVLTLLFSNHGLAQEKTKIDMVIGYSPFLEAKYGGEKQVLNRIHAFVALFNHAFENSNIDACIVANHIYKSQHHFTEDIQFDQYKASSETQSKREQFYGDIMIYFADTYDKEGQYCTDGHCGILHIQDSYNGSPENVYSMINFHRTLSQINSSSMAGYMGAIRAEANKFNVGSHDYRGWCNPLWPGVATIASHNTLDNACRYKEQYPVFSGPSSKTTYPIVINADGSIETGSITIRNMGSLQNDNASKINNVKSIVANFRYNPNKSCTSNTQSVLGLLSILNAFMVND